MTTFSIRPSGFNEIKKKLLIKIVLISAIASSIGIGVAVANDSTSGSFNIWPYYIIILIALQAFRANSKLKKTKATFQSYHLTISDEGVITREQLSLNPLSVSAIEISDISKYKNGSFCIKGLTKADVIYVPAQIEHAELLEIELNKLHPVSVLTHTPVKQQLTIVIAVINLVCMLGVFISSNKWIVAIGGLILIASMVYLFIVTRQSKNVPEQAKRKSWIYLLVLILVLINVLVKVFGVDLSQLY